MISGYELFETWLKNSKDLSQDIGHVQALIDSATASDIKKFREIVCFLKMKSSLPHNLFHRLQRQSTPK